MTQPPATLLLIDELEVGGTQRQIAALVQGMAARGRCPLVGYFRNESYLADQMRASGAEVIRFERRGRFDLAFPLRIARELRQRNVGLVHAFGLSAETWGAAARALVPGRTGFVSSVRGRYEWYSRLQWRVKSWVSARSDVVIANSAAGGAYAVECHGVPAAKLVVVPNGVDLEGFDARRQEGTPGTGYAAFKVAFVGRLVDHKNLECLLRAVAACAGAGVDIALHVVGDGPLRQELVEFAARLDITSRVVWHGESDGVPVLLSGADCFALTSHREGLSNALLEGMAAGLPVVATAVGGSVEAVVDGGTGFLVPPDDHAAVAERFMRLAADGGLRATMGAAGRRRVEEVYSRDAMVDRMLEIYGRVLAGNAGGSFRG